MYECSLFYILLFSFKFNKLHLAFRLQLTGLSKILAHELGPPLRNLTVLPLLLSQERDDDLLRITENRIPVFAHDMVPDYLRTKPEPTAEQRMLQHEQKVSGARQRDIFHNCI